MSLNIVQELIVQALPFIFAITLHESAHGWAAEKCGDSTARDAGRISLNPLVHIDPVGTVIMPLALKLMNSSFMFGYAKPVPVNFAALNRPKRDMAIVAFAGPCMNMLLAVASGILCKLILVFFSFFPIDGVIVQTFRPTIMMLQFSVFFNIFLGIFNLIPIVPLDGGRIMAGLLPEPYSGWVRSTERYGIFIIMLLFIVDPFHFVSRGLYSLVQFLALGILA